MRIGLVRHFRVKHPFPSKIFLRKDEVIKWFAGYDTTTDLDYKSVELLAIQWEQCYSSPMPRAKLTASYIYKGVIVEQPELKELDILHRLPDWIVLPFVLWAIVVRIQSKYPSRDTKVFKANILSFIDRVIATGKTDVLIVSHWFVMRVIRKELIKRGWSGDRFKSNVYGELCVFTSPH